MIVHRAHRPPLLLLLPLLLSADAASGREINGTASDGNYIHVEKEVDLRSSGYRSKINITSDVPVTVQRYSDSGSFSMGQQPVPESMAKVLVTSNCDSTQTKVVSDVTVSPTGDITVAFVGLDEGNVEFNWLEPSSYSAFWTWASGICGFDKGEAPDQILNPFEGPDYIPIDPMVLPTAVSEPVDVQVKPDTVIEECPRGQCRDPTNGRCADQVSCFASPCEMQTAPCDNCVDNYCGGCHAVCNPIEDLFTVEESCNPGLSCDRAGSTCERGAETCCGVTHPSFKCDCVAKDDGSLAYDGCLNTDSCSFPSCCGSGPPVGMPRPAPGTCDMGSLCDSGIEDDYCCMAAEGTYCSKSGGTTAVDGTTSTPGIPSDPVFLSPAICEAGPDADASMTCASGEFCQLEAGLCKIELGVFRGTCIKIPDFCTEEYDPVCGCDQTTTHDNPCHAQSASDSVSYRGECDATKPTTEIDVVGQDDGCRFGPGDDPSRICGAGEFCALDAGVCNNEVGAYEGTCAATPENCFALYEPVCGCDQNTYSNGCEAAREGISVSRTGTCDDVTAEPTDPANPSVVVDVGQDDRCEVDLAADTTMTCGAEKFCKLETGVCNSGTGLYRGTCTAMSGSCLTLYEPVCGCDQNTYSNGCEAAAAGVSVSRTAACDVVPAKPANPVLPQQGDRCELGPAADPRATCGVGDFCQLRDGACNSKIGIFEGTCTATPDECDSIDEPVCGCDQITYTSVCDAHFLGVSVSRIGECDAISAPGETTSTTQATAANCDPCEDISDGFVQMPNTNCAKFAQCVNGDTIGILNCNDGLIFDVGIDRCNWESITKCGPDPVCSTSEATTATVANVESVNVEPTPRPISSVSQSSSPTGLLIGAETTPATVTESVTVESTASPISTAPQSSSPTGSPIKAEIVMPSKSPLGVSTENPTRSPSKEETGVPSKSSIEMSSSTPTGSPNKAATKTPSMSPIGVSDPSSTGAPSTNGGATAATTAATAASSFDFNGNFPTTKPSNNKLPTPSPTDWWETPVGDNSANSENSAFRHSGSLSFCMATAFVAIVVISLIFPGFGGHNNLGGYGKFAVAAVAASSLYSKTSLVSKGGNVRRSNGKGLKPFPAKNERALQPGICTFNVEVLIDGCAHPLEISAPAGRVVDVVIDDLISEERKDDACTVDYEANLTFPVLDRSDVLDLDVDGTVDALPEFDYQCLRPIDGRPFVDATGGSLQAMPWIPDEQIQSASALSWTGEASLHTHSSLMNNVTSHGRVLLGEDWVQRALGEHASVASFSAFSIALMSNAAPAVLVEDALKAGLDEICHARTSLGIASMLTGREVDPGPLPESKLQFGQDLKALAFAVAREGCVDETLSAFAATAEAKHTNEVLDMEVQDTPYPSIDCDLLASIRNELITISMDESNYSTLAWRTLKWVCSVD